jgi:hypothetical protein
MLSQIEKEEIAKRLTAIYRDNSVYYRNDLGNGSVGPCAYRIEDDGDLADSIEGIIGDGVDSRVVDHCEILDDRDGDPVTARELIQEAIAICGDFAEVSADDLIVEVCNDNGWRGYYWIWSY